MSKTTYVVIDIEPDPQCPACGGEPALLGDLGTLRHLRCQQCGWDWSIPAPPDPDYEERIAGLVADACLAEETIPYRELETETSS